MQSRKPETPLMNLSRKPVPGSEKNLRPRAYRFYRCGKTPPAISTKNSQMLIKDNDTSSLIKLVQVNLFYLIP
jgi:hypothetical protein